MQHEPTVVTDDDRRSFQRWLKAEKSRYGVTRGMRKRPEGLRPDHARITSGSVAIGKGIRESLPLALAALVVHEKREGDALAFLRAWVGRFQDMADEAVGFLNRERDSVGQVSVFGVWCADESCRQFIRPVAVPRKPTPTPSSATSSVCGSRRCQRVTVFWLDDQGVWVRTAPELKKHNHPMPPLELYAWVERSRPLRNRPARLIAP